MRKILLALVMGTLLFLPAAAHASGSHTYTASDGTRFQQLYGYGTAALAPSGEFTLAAVGVAPNTSISGGWKFAIPNDVPATAVVAADFSAANLNNGAVAAYQLSTGQGPCAAPTTIAAGQSEVAGAGVTCILGSGIGRFVTVTFSGQAGQGQAVSLSGQLHTVTLSW
jgi:hypothetical protein